MGGVLHQEPRRVERKLFFLPYSVHKEHWGLHYEGHSPPSTLLPHPQLPWCFLYDEAKPSPKSSFVLFVRCWDNLAFWALVLFVL